MASATSSRYSFVALLLVISGAYGQLSPTFYATTCPNLASIVRSAMITATNADRRMGASLLRLHFHDCFVQGCDASILLNDVGSFQGEKTAFPNANSLRGYDAIDTIKKSVELSCAGVVSCADILALAARDGTVLLGGPTWTVPLGRRDSTSASWTLANSDLPPPFANISGLITGFAKKGFTPREMTALSGAHTIGFAQCKNYRDHIYKDNNIDPVFAANLQKSCSSVPPNNDANLAPFDLQTGLVFDNDYYANLAAMRTLLHSDMVLYNGGAQSQAMVVSAYKSNSTLFFQEFAAAMVKMGNISPLTGTAGQIRRNCTIVNP